jgi:hypothetical protein
MISNSENDQTSNPLSQFISLIVLLAAALYFTGWTYRWAYFALFHVEVISLNLPVESFYIAAFQALFGEPSTILRTCLGFLLACLGTLLTLAIYTTLRTITFQIYLNLRKSIERQLRRPRSMPLLVPMIRFILRKRLLLNLRLTELNSIQFVTSLIDELIIVLWVLATLFLLAQWQGNSDAWKDAVNETSFLPVVTLLMPEGNAALGRNLHNSTSDPSGFRVIGDRQRYNELVGKEITETDNPNNSDQLPRVWRLLIDRESSFYIFPALPEKEKHCSVPVLVVRKSGLGDQLMILTRPDSSDDQ